MADKDTLMYDYDDKEWEQLTEEEQQEVSDRTMDDCWDMMYPNGRDPE